MSYMVCPVSSYSYLWRSLQLVMRLSFLVFWHVCALFREIANQSLYLLTISPISFIFDSARNLSYHPLWRFVQIPITWWEWRNTKWEKWLARRFMKYHLYASCFSHFANIFSLSFQFDEKCIAGYEKKDWRDSLWNATYTLLVSLILPTFFHVLVNLSISV